MPSSNKITILMKITFPHALEQNHKRKRNTDTDPDWDTHTHTKAKKRSVCMCIDLYFLIYF